MANRNAARYLVTLGIVIVAVAVFVVVNQTGGDDDATVGGGGGQATGANGELEPREALMLIGASPGGGSDLMGRTFADWYVQAVDGAEMTPENYDPLQSYMILKQQHSGDPNVVMTANYSSAIVQPIAQNVDYHWSDFNPAAVFGQDYLYLIVPDGSPFKTFDDLRAAAESGRLTAGVVGAGGTDSVALEQLASKIGAQFETVEFDGGGEQLSAVLAGDLDFAAMEPAEFYEQMEAGKVRGLLGLTDQASDDEVLGEIPLAAEAGVEAEYVNQWRAFFAPPEISDADLAYWVEAVRQWTESDSYDNYVTSNFVSPDFVAGDELTTFLEEKEASFREYLEKSGS